MPPLIPYHVSAGSNPVVKFGGALVTEFLEPPPGRCFAFRQKYCLKPPMDENHPDYDKINEALNHPSGPPLHFHPFQNEYFRVEQGRMCVEMDGVLRTLTPADGEVMGRAGSIHRFYIAPDSTEDMIIILSASDSGLDYQLDRVFFENWYGLWHDYLVHEGKMDLIQLLCTYDAGDAYLLPPAWLPNRVRKLIGYWGGVIVGRWIGRLLGYKPFFKEYTTDWAYAVHKMEASSFTRQVVGRSFTSAMSWAQLQMCATQWQYGGGTEGFVTPDVKVPISNGHK
ncbi:hypothetical protein N7520_005905 [Penicillium odoratum]|uniref:uncharacterized protein n=1 Tax=Penicillium odoratum TaxID=1167516 RepID=UPI0025487F53|nr:uncharacterized protein N7520_005905 [Penicillium odoratum]KAJ5758749.1 hypothetical protein N7520_005905 [Penicillium odoratum]